MFGLTPRPGPSRRPDPLQSRRAAAEWFRGLPALDVIGRQAHVVAAFAALQREQPEFDLDRIAALVYLDTMVAVDRRRLVKWYFENLRGSARLSDRFWQSAHELSLGFVDAYQPALDAALARATDARYRACLPRLAGRLIHHHGIDATLRLFRGERVTASTWRTAHALFLRACELGFERSDPHLPGEDPGSDRGTVEHEYLHLLLIDRLRTGNQTPEELDWASRRLRAWSTGLSLATAPPAAEGFYVDLAGMSGLERYTGTAVGAKVAYLDTAPLVAALERTVEELKAPDPNTAGDADAGPDPVKQQRIATLEKLRPAILPERHAELRRHARVEVDLPVDVRVGLARIAHEFSAGNAARSGGGGWGTRWRLLDRSGAGWRVSAPVDGAQGVGLGALIALLPADDDQWMLGVVSRTARGPKGELVAGMSMIASRIIPVTLYGRRSAQAEMNFVVDGFDVSTLGARFDGLYLMPPSRLDTRPAARTLIVPTSEYFDGRNVVLATARSNYAVTLGRTIDQRADWSWATIRVSGKLARSD